MLTGVEGMRAWIADVRECDGEQRLDHEPSDEALAAAAAILDADPDGGAGNPALIRRAAQAAHDAGDAKLGNWIAVQAESWERYLGGLAEAMRR